VLGVNLAPSLDIVVIGAGAAGLVVARDLGRAGYRVGLFEARRRAGGRIATVASTTGGPPIELGAEFIHGSPRETIELLDEAGLCRKPVGAEAAELGPGGLAPGSAFFEAVGRVLATLERTASDDRTFSDWIREQKLPRELERRVASYVEGFYASSANRIGTLGIVRELRGARARGDDTSRPQAGYGALVDFLVRSLDPRVELHLGTPVERVRWSKEGVYVDAVGPTGRITRAARRAVVTLPVGVLRSAQVRFEPPLVGKATALLGLDPGAARRITFELRDDPRPRLGRATFLHLVGCPVPTFWTSFSDKTFRLVGWVGGSTALAVTHDEFERAAAVSLGRALGMSEAELERSIAGAHAHDWIGDRHTLGVYAYTTAGASDAPERLAEPIDDVLFFAGEATHHEGELGTVAAAIATGHRAAAEIAARPS
jgi:monoamine oxidase